MSDVTPQTVYDVKARRISGTRDEKLEQIDMAIQELLDIKTLECASAHPNVRFLAVPRPRSHGVAATVMILVALAVLALLVGVRTSHAQDVTAPAPPQTASQPVLTPAP